LRYHLHNSVVRNVHLQDNYFEVSICPTIVIPLTSVSSVFTDRADNPTSVSSVFTDRADNPTSVSSVFTDRADNPTSVSSVFTDRADTPVNSAFTGGTNSVNNRHVFKVRSLIDSGSSTNWIAPGILNNIKHQVIGNTVLNVKTFDNEHKEKYKLVEVYTDNPFLPSFKCFVMKVPSQAQIVHNMSDKLRTYCSTYEQDHDIMNEWLDPYSSTNVDHDDTGIKNYGLIVSSNIFNKIRCSNTECLKLNKKSSGLNLLLEKTCFGYTLSGPVPLANTMHFNKGIQTRVVPDEHFFSKDHSLKEDLRILWDRETLGIYEHELHMNDEAALQSFRDTVKLDPKTGQYEVGLPFNERKSLLKDNYKMAYARARSEQRRMILDSDYRCLFADALHTLKEQNYIEQVELEEPVEGPIVYLPYRGIVRKDHASTKCRIVMDASAKTSINDFSLNQALYTGPNKIADLSQCLLKFMAGRHACVADIRQAFLRIWIRKTDRDVQRFLVPEDLLDPNSKMICYRYTSVMFGSAASPFLLAAVLEKHIQDTCANDMVKAALLFNTYVDNISFAAKLEKDINTFFTESIDDMAKGGFEIRQWASNSPQVMSQARSLNIAENADMVNVLGMLWDIKSDTIRFKPKIKWDGQFVKQSALGATMSLFDPLGLLNPIEVPNRLFLQKLWEGNYAWKNSFENDQELRDQWLDLLNKSVQAVELFNIPREIVLTDDSEIHVFADASGDSYGAAVYVVNPPTGKRPKGYSKLILSKGKIKPLQGSPKGNTIPKLELTAMLVGAHLARFVFQTFELKSSTDLYLHSDAKVVLDWLNSVELDSTYVHRRVVAIRTTCPTAIVRHVPTDDNPADLITRRQPSVDKFLSNDKWWHGPSWLILPKSEWPHQNTLYTLQPKFREKSQVVQVNINVALLQAFTNFESYVLPEPPLILTSMTDRYKSLENKGSLFYFRHDTFRKSMRLMTNVIRFVYSNRRFRGYDLFDKSGLSWYNFTKLYGLKQAQKECFPYELNTLLEGGSVTKGPCSTFGLVLDFVGVIRCGAFRHNQVDPLDPFGPVLVAPEHPFVYSYIYSKHFHSNCSSRDYTLNKVKREIHGPGVRAVVYKLVHDCVLCKQSRALYLKYRYPLSPKLPSFRTTFVAPFSACGVDLAGPFVVLKDTSRLKVWICLFTCLTTRAIYLVLLHDLRASTFLRALRELCSRHSTPLIMVSDNATNFVPVSQILEKIRTELKDLLPLSTEWRFISVKAPWFGGTHERLIGIMKNELLKMTRGIVITYDEFKSHMFEVERVVNDRPLMRVGRTEVVTPHMLIYGRTMDSDGHLSSIQVDTLLEDTKILGKKLPEIYANGVRRRKQFWQSFQAQYLDMLKFRSGGDIKGGGKDRIPKKGDLVMIHDADPRIKPKKGLITEVIRSVDGEIRTCKVKIGRKESVRAVPTLRDLEMNVFDETEIGVRQNGGDNSYRKDLYKKLLANIDTKVSPGGIHVDNRPPLVGVKEVVDQGQVRPRVSRRRAAGAARVNIRELSDRNLI